MPPPEWMPRLPLSRCKFRLGPGRRGRAVFRFGFPSSLFTLPSEEQPIQPPPSQYWHGHCVDQRRRARLWPRRAIGGRYQPAWRSTSLVSGQEAKRCLHTPRCERDDLPGRMPADALELRTSSEYGYCHQNSHTHFANGVIRLSGQGAGLAVPSGRRTILRGDKTTDPVVRAVANSAVTPGRGQAPAYRR